MGIKRKGYWIFLSNRMNWRFKGSQLGRNKNLHRVRFVLSERRNCIGGNGQESNDLILEIAIQIFSIKLWYVVGAIIEW